MMALLERGKRPQTPALCERLTALLELDERQRAGSARRGAGYGLLAMMREAFAEA